MYDVFFLCSGQKIQTSVERMIRIWKERKIFKNNFLSELTTSLGVCGFSDNLCTAYFIFCY